MTVREALQAGRTQLLESETPDLDAAVLLAHTWGIDRAQLYTRLPDVLPREIWRTYQRALLRREAGEPAAWIVGVKEFWGRDFQVGPGVLCPRPDTETLVEAALEAMEAWERQGRFPWRFHDVCTGPGTVALTLGLECPGWEAGASDISPQAEEFFQRNARALQMERAVFTAADLLEGIAGPFAVITGNPPYLTPGETRERMAGGWQEPSLALDGGDRDGLGIIRRLVPQAGARLLPGGSLLLEAAPLQMPALEKILLDGGFTEIKGIQDLARRDRVIWGKKPGD